MQVQTPKTLEEEEKKKEEALYHEVAVNLDDCGAYEKRIVSKKNVTLNLAEVTV